MIESLENPELIGKRADTIRVKGLLERYDQSVLLQILGLVHHAEAPMADDTTDAILRDERPGVAQGERKAQSAATGPAVLRPIAVLSTTSRSVPEIPTDDHSYPMRPDQVSCVWNDAPDNVCLPERSSHRFLDHCLSAYAPRSRRSPLRRASVAMGTTARFLPEDHRDAARSSARERLLSPRAAIKNLQSAI
ncbi:MAG: hypothetical protein ACUVS4_16840 [Chloroflexaceae bacterium]